MNIKNKEFYILAIILLFVGLFQATLLNKTSIWHDEAFSVLLPQYNFGQMIYRIGLDVHPPLYYILLKGWFFLFGNSVFTLRSFSLLFGILSVITFFYLIRFIFKDRKLSLFLSALFLLNCFFIQYEIEGRMYTLALFFSLASTFFLLKALKGKKWYYWLLYSLFVSFGIYTHYYVFFLVFAQVAFLAVYFVKVSKRSLKRIISNRNFIFSLLAFFLVLMLFIPWLKTFLYQFRQVEQSYWIPKMNEWSIPATLWKLSTGSGIDMGKPSSKIILALISLLVLFFLFYFLKIVSPTEKWLILFLFLLPFLFSVLLSLKRSVYLDRYFIFVLPFYIAIIGVSLWGKYPRPHSYWFRNILVFLALLASLISFPLYWRKLEVDKKPGMKGAAGYLNHVVEPGEKIYVGSSFVFFTFKYYNKTPVSPKLFAPGELSHFSGTALLTKKDIIKDFNQGAEKGDIVYLINTTGFGNYQPTVPKKWRKLEEKGFEDVYAYRGWILVSKYQVQ